MLRANKPLGLIIVALLAISMLLPACGETATATPTKAAAAATQAPSGTVVAAATATPAAPAATPTKTVKTGGTYTVVTQADSAAGHLDAHYGGLTGWVLFFDNVYQSLMTHDRNTFEIIPGLAEKWEVATDGKSVTLYLRKGVKWHNLPPVNGREFTSDDVVWNLNRMRDAKAQPTATMYPYISVIDTVTAPDKYTVKITLKEAYSPIVFWLAHNGCMMYPKELFDQYGTKQSKVAIGTGPFMFKSYEPNVQLTLVKNPDYYEPGLPRIDSLKFVIIADKAARLSAIRSGQVEGGDSLAKADADALKASTPTLQIFDQPGMAYYLRLNALKAPLTNKALRQAINLTLDRQQIMQLTGTSGKLMGVFRSDVFPVGLYRGNDYWAKQPGMRQPKDQDIAAAKKLMADAGITNATIEALAASNDPVSATRNEVIKDQLSKIGITWNIKMMEYTAIGTLLYPGGGDYQAVFQSGSGGDDADRVMNTFHSQRLSYAPSGWTSPELDALLDKGRAETDNAKRIKIYQEFEDKVIDMAGLVPMFQSSDFMVLASYVREHKPVPGMLAQWYGLNYKYLWLDK